MSLSIAHRNLAPGCFHKNDKGNNRYQRQHHRDHSQSREHVPFGNAIHHLRDSARQSDHDAGKDKQRNSIAHASLRDLLTEPHHEDRAGCQSQHRRQEKAQAPRFAKARSDLINLQPVRHKRSLQTGEANSQISRPLIDLLTTHLAFFLQLL